MSSDALPRRPLVAIFGAGRNGSTMLGRLLDGGPDLWSHPTEVNYLCVFDDLATRGEPAFDSIQNARLRPLTGLGASVPTELLWSAYAHDWGDIRSIYLSRLEGVALPHAEPLELLSRRSAYRADEFLPAYLEAMRLALDPSRDRKALLFKTIEVPYVDDYRRVFPELKCLHIVRDPLTNYASEKRTWMYRKDRPFYGGAEDYLSRFLEHRWTPHVRAALRLREGDPEHHLIVRYEDVCADPPGSVRRIFEWLGLKPPADSAEQTVLGGRRMTTLPSNPSQPGIATPRRVEANMASRFGYRDVLAPREQALLTRCTKPLAQRLGYDLAPKERDIGALRLWLRWVPVDEAERLHVRRRLGSQARWVIELARRRVYVARKLATSRGDGR